MRRNYREVSKIASRSQMKRLIKVEKRQEFVHLELKHLRRHSTINSISILLFFSILFVIQFLFYNNYSENEAPVNDTLSEIMLQLDEIQSLIAINDVFNAQTDPIQSDLDLDILIGHISERINSIEGEKQETQSSFALLSLVSGIAWWGVVFLFSAPFVAFYLYGVMRKSHEARIVAYAILFLGIAGSIFGIGVLGTELASDLVSQFGWVVPPTILGSSISTFIIINLLSDNKKIPQYGVSSISIICIFLSFCLFITDLSVTEGCYSYWSLICKAKYIINTVDYNRYLVSFSALLLAATFYLVGAAVAARKIFSGT